MKVLTIEEANKMILPGRTLEEYQKDYDYIINLAKPRGLDKSKINFYCEIHHILARALGGTDEDDNLVALSYLEHIVIHVLLFRMHPDNDKLFYPAWAMIVGWYSKRGERSEFFGTIKNKIVEFEKILKQINLEVVEELKIQHLRKVKRMPVICHLDGKISGIFESQAKAAELLGLNFRNINKNIKRSSNHSHFKYAGYSWDSFENFCTQYDENFIKEFLENYKINDVLISVAAKPTEKCKLVCYSINSNKIYKIYENMSSAVIEDGFSHDLIWSATNRHVSDHNKSSYLELGMTQGYRWIKLNDWEDSLELENYYSNKNNLNNPIPYSFCGLLEIDSNNNVLKEYSSIKKAEKEEHKALNLLLTNLPPTENIVKTVDNKMWIRTIDYARLFEDKWLDYLRHKKENSTITESDNGDIDKIV